MAGQSSREHVEAMEFPWTVSQDELGSNSAIVELVNLCDNHLALV
jgi:hypothetical protein